MWSTPIAQDADQGQQFLTLSGFVDLILLISADSSLHKVGRSERARIPSHFIRGIARDLSCGA